GTTLFWLTVRPNPNTRMPTLIQVRTRLTRSLRLMVHTFKTGASQMATVALQRGTNLPVK
ncbi:hypothetical protein ABTA63_19580, partial [Acinetobacter baumannii]